MIRPITKNKESYDAVFQGGETLNLELNTESGQIRFELYQERWRMPDEAVELLRRTADLIEEKFYEKGN